MKLTYELLTNMNLTTSLIKLRDVEFPIATIYQLKKTFEAIEKEMKRYNELYQQLVGRHAEKNEDGSLKFSPENPQMALIKKGSEDDLRKELTELLLMEVEIEGTLPVDMEKLPVSLKLTLNEVDVLSRALQVTPAEGKADKKKSKKAS